MTKQVLNNLEGLATHRTKLNNNFTELYDGKLPSTNTKAQFDTACTDDNFAFLGQANTFTANQAFTGLGDYGFRLTPGADGSGALLYSTNAANSNVLFELGKDGKINNCQGITINNEGQALTLNGSAHSFIGFSKAGSRKAYIGFPGAGLNYLKIKNEETSGGDIDIETGSGRNLLVNGQNRTSGWTTFTPSFTGSSGTVGTYQERLGKYIVMGKTCTVSITLRADKNTLAGSIMVPLPFSCNIPYQSVFVTLADYGSTTKYHQGEIVGGNLTIQKAASTNSYNYADMGSNIMLKATFTYETT